MSELESRKGTEDGREENDRDDERVRERDGDS